MKESTEMKSQLLERKSLVQSTVAAMRTQIAERTWRVGDRIPPEGTLAATFGVGRNTVREAVRVLSSSHMLEVRQGDGTYVISDVDAVQTVRSLASTKVVDHLEMQQMLETDAARFAAQRATTSDVQALRELLAARGEYTHKVANTQEELDDFLERDTRFHKAIAAASHNSALTALYDYFVSLMRPHTRDIIEQGNLPEPDLAAHAAIVDAICARDEVAAAAAAHRMMAPLIAYLRSASEGADRLD